MKQFIYKTLLILNLKFLRVSEDFDRFISRRTIGQPGYDDAVLRASFEEVFKRKPGQ